ncbi:BatA domain-containing protein [bacterium]|nr:BatA domain-containing protein [bacterium]
MDFLNGALLAGLFAISIPIIIHLLNRRRFKVLHWAAMEFLLEANRKNRKTVQIQHLLVLLLRCLAIALIVFAVARPYATQGALASLPGTKDVVERIIIVDDSASTGEKEGDRTAFDEEKKLLHDPGREVGKSGFLDDLKDRRKNDLITVIRGSRLHAPDLVRAEASRASAEEFSHRVDGWLPSDTRFPLAQAIRAGLSGEMRSGQKALGAKRFVYILTDFRKSDWMSDPGHAPEALDAMRQAGADTSFFVVDCGHAESHNVGITGLRPQEKLVTAGIGQKLLASVKNFGKQTAHDVRVELSVGSSSVPCSPIGEIKPGETRVIEISYTFADPGPYAVSVRIAADRDGLPADDRRDMALEVVKAVRVLLVDGFPGEDPTLTQTFFLERALMPPGEVRSGVEAVTVPAERLADEDLSSYHTIILCNLDRWPAQRLPSLERYVRDGGGLAFFLGDNIDAAAYERELWKNGSGLLPCKLGELIDTGPYEAAPRLAAPSLDHPLLRVFTTDDNPFIAKVRSRKHYALPVDRSKDGTSTPIARYDDVASTPAIIEKAYGEGRVVLFNTTANKDWTEWMGHAAGMSFVILSQELVRHLAPTSTTGRNVMVGQPVLRSINPAVFDPKAKLRVPNEKTPHELLAARRDQGDSLWFNYADTDKAGVYELELTPRASGATPRVESFAVELDSREGELEKAEPETVTKLLEGVKVTVAKAGTASLLSLTEGEKRELWRTCAMLLLFVLAAEGVLSFIAAHHGHGAPPEEVEAARASGRRIVPTGLPMAAAQTKKSTSLPMAGG